MKKKIKKPTKEWFIYPLNSETNEVIARELAKTIEIDEVETERGWMFRCSYSHINAFLKATAHFNLQFKVFRRRKTSHKIEEWKFCHKKRVRRSKKFQKARKEIEKKK